jgi:hypothetical protein
MAAHINLIHAFGVKADSGVCYIDDHTFVHVAGHYLVVYRSAPVFARWACLTPEQR